MAGLGDMVQKAFYLGVGLASLAKEKATGLSLTELMSQAQRLADDMVTRGEMTAEEARKYVDDLVQQAQQPTSPEYIPQDNSPKEPRPIEILDENEDPTAEKTDQLKKQVEALEEELRRLKRQ